MPQDGLPEFKPLVAPQPPSPRSNRPPAPQTVEAAFWLIIASTALTLVVQAFDLLAIGLRGGAAPTSPYLVGTVVGIGLRVLFAFAVRQGANFARILLTLGAALSIVALATGFNVLLLVIVVIFVTAVVLLWLPQSNGYFRAAAASRAEAKAGNLPR